MKANEFGRSVVKILGILILIGILCVAGIAKYNEVRYENNLNVSKEQMATIADNIRKAYSSRRNYDNLNNETAIALGVIPEDMITDDHRIVDALGAEIAISATNSLSGGHCDATEFSPCDSFAIKITGMPKKQTIDFATSSWADLKAFGVLIDKNKKTD